MDRATRASVHTRPTAFRMNDKLFASVEERARQEGMTLSEFIRHAVRRELKSAA